MYTRHVKQHLLSVRDSFERSSSLMDPAPHTTLTRYHPCLASSPHPKPSPAQILRPPSPQICLIRGKRRLLAPSRPAAALSEKYSTVICFPTCRQRKPKLQEKPLTICDGSLANLIRSSVVNPVPTLTRCPSCSIQTLLKASWMPYTPSTESRILDVSISTTVYSAS